ncbi:hypothetical protein ACWD4O_39025 [Streptomyces sp. NPDC002623]
MDAPAPSTLSDTEYETLLIANLSLRHRDPAVWEQVMSEALIGRTRKALGEIHQRTANSLRKKKSEREEFHQDCWRRGEAGKREWFQTLPEYETSRRKAASFHQRVQATIAQVTKIQRDRNRAGNHLNLNESRETLRKLAVAVQRHQAMHAKSGEIAGQEDYELWQLLDRLTVPLGPNQDPTTLRTMLDFYWTDVDVVTVGEADQEAAERTMRQAPAGRSAQFSGVPRARHVGNHKDLAS